MNKPYPVVGIGGLNGSGKDTIGELLEDDFGFKFISVTNLLRDEANKQGLEVSRNNLHEISANWRLEHGLGVLVVKAVEVYESDSREKKGLAISSLRNPGENDEIHRLGGFVVWADGDRKVRFERITNANRHRDVEDHITFKEFVENEIYEMTSEKPERLNLAGVKAKADVYIENSGKDIDKFKNNVKEVLKDKL